MPVSTYIHFALAIVAFIFFLWQFIKERKLYEFLFLIWIPATLLIYLDFFKADRPRLILCVVQVILFIAVIYLLFRRNGTPQQNLEEMDLLSEESQTQGETEIQTASAIPTDSATEGDLDLDAPSDDSTEA